MNSAEIIKKTYFISFKKAVNIPPPIVSSRAENIPSYRTSYNWWMRMKFSISPENPFWPLPCINKNCKVSPLSRSKNPLWKVYRHIRRRVTISSSRLWIGQGQRAREQRDRRLVGQQSRQGQSKRSCASAIRHGQVSRTSAGTRPACHRAAADALALRTMPPRGPPAGAGCDQHRRGSTRLELPIGIITHAPSGCKRKIRRHHAVDFDDIAAFVAILSGGWRGRRR